ncbi:hypothetical protein FoTM2_012955 [Fusarium oxysporum f. sp. vasinfectum]|nr:hypothetical protein FoTM2_012955 [Fusarium oxysporum f. sp. vasinfectum]
MKPVLALTVCLSGIMGAEAWVLPPVVHPRLAMLFAQRISLVTRTPPTPRSSSHLVALHLLLQSQTVSSLASSTPKTGGSKRSGIDRRDDGDDGDGDSSDDGAEGDPEVTIFTRPATRIGTLKKGETSGNDNDGGDDETNDDATKTKSKQDDDKNTTKTKKEDSTKTKSSDDATKSPKVKDDKKGSKDDKKADDKKSGSKGSDDKKVDDSKKKSKST